jgi:penicillin-insensitive murein DD-endopeptidase
VVSLLLGPVVAASWLLVAAAAPPDEAGAEQEGAPSPPAGQPLPVPGIAPLPIDPLKLRADAFSRFREPSEGKPIAVGSTSNGCLIGGKPLPRSGPGFEVMRLGRNRRFGHPALVAYIQRLAAAAKKKKIGTLLIGDLAQPRGGPTPTGHRSHQTGLDVDIGFTRPAWLARRRLKASEREQLPLTPVLDLTTRTFTAEWTPQIEQLIELAASDPEVDRVFVHPRIKRELCDHASARAAAKPATRTRSRSKADAAAPDLGWLRTVRPWWGHHDHLHVRLKCPADSVGCESQAPLPPGDGCSEIAWWETEEARRARDRRDPPAPVEPRAPAPLPAACQALLEQVPSSATAQRPR